MKTKRLRGVWLSLMGVLLTGLAAAEALGQSNPGTLADSNGQLVAWGLNNYGQCNVPSGSYSAIDSGGWHTMALRSDGSLAAWGYNYDGQCDVPAGYNYTSVVATDYHSLALRTDGTLLAWGRNDTGACNVAPGTYRAMAAGWSHSVGLKTDGSLAAWGNNYWGQCNVPTGNNFAAVAAGYEWGLALRKDGSLAAWGRDDYGQVSSVPTGNNFAAISSGYGYGLALRTDGSLTAWGSNGAGQCNVPSGNNYTAISSGSAYGLALRNNGSIAAWGSNLYGQCNVPDGAFVAVSGGSFHALALRARTDYDGDLVVSGTGIKANLNRSVTVNNNVMIDPQTVMWLYNNPAMSVYGEIAMGDHAQIVGNGRVSCWGALKLNGFAELHVTNVSVGSLAGSGELWIDNGARLDVGDSYYYGSRAFSGGITVNWGVLSFNSYHGALTPSWLDVGIGGEVRVGPGSRLAVSFAGYNAGSVQALGNPYDRAEIEHRGHLHNAASTGLIVGRDAVLRFNGGLTNEGSLAVPAGSTDVFGDIDNTGTITVTGGATAIFYDDVTQNGSMVVRKLGSVSSMAVFLGSLNGGFTGGGDVFVEGDLRPGNSPAAVLFDGNLGLGPLAQTVIELAGPAPGTGYDQITVTGTLAADGQLRVVLLDGFQPQLGQEFDILRYGSLSGNFDAISLPALDGGLNWQVNSGAKGLEITVVPEPSALTLLALAVLGLVLLGRRHAFVFGVRESAAGATVGLSNRVSGTAGQASSGTQRVTSKRTDHYIVKPSGRVVFFGTTTTPSRIMPYWFSSVDVTPASLRIRTLRPMRQFLSMIAWRICVPSPTPKGGMPCERSSLSCSEVS